MLKKILIPVAAFAVTVTAASAFTGGNWTEKLNIDLTDTQISALEQAQEIRQEANDEARQLLEDAGLDNEKMQEVHNAMREARDEGRAAMKTAMDDNDYDAFQAAIVDTPLADKITSEADFEKFVEAHDLMESGDHDAAKEIMDELGLEGMGGPEGMGQGHMGEGRGNGEGRQGGGNGEGRQNRAS